MLLFLSDYSHHIILVSFILEKYEINFPHPSDHSYNYMQYGILCQQ